MKRLLAITALPAVVLPMALSVVGAQTAAAQCLSSQDVTNVRYTGETKRVVAQQDGQYPETITITRQYTSSNSWNASISVSASVVNAAVGFDTGSSTTTGYSAALATKDVGKGTWRLYVDSVYRNYSYDVKTINAVCTIKHGTGTAKKWVRYSSHHSKVG